MGAQIPLAAISHYQQALLLDPNDAVAHTNWGLALQAQQQYGEAIGHYQKALLLDPNHAQAHTGWGNALKAQQQRMRVIAENIANSDSTGSWE